MSGVELKFDRRSCSSEIKLNIQSVDGGEHKKKLSENKFASEYKQNKPKTFFRFLPSTNNFPMDPAPKHFSAFLLQFAQCKANVSRLSVVATIKKRESTDANCLQQEEKKTN